MLAKIRRMYFRDKVPVREIARRTGLSRNTVRNRPRQAIVDEQDQRLVRLIDHFNICSVAVKNGRAWEDVIDRTGRRWQSVFSIVKLTDRETTVRFNVSVTLA